MAEPTQEQPTGKATPKSHLITLRLWREASAGDHAEWRGKLHHVATDEVAYFRDWAALLPLVLAMLRRAGVTITATVEPWEETELLAEDQANETSQV